MRTMYNAPAPYSIRIVRTFKGMEGTGFNGTLWRDGKKVAAVDDYGDGGQVGARGWVSKDEASAFATFVNGLPPVPFEGRELAQSEDLFLGQLAESAEFLRWATRACSKRTLFQLEEDPADDCTWRALDKPYSRKSLAELKAEFGSRLACLLNADIGQTAV